MKIQEKPSSIPTVKFENYKFSVPQPHQMFFDRIRELPHLTFPRNFTNTACKAG
jgi:hypothetical protein